MKLNFRSVKKRLFLFLTFYYLLINELFWYEMLLSCIGIFHGYLSLGILYLSDDILNNA